MKKTEHRIINALLDKYESSKTFTGENKVNQSFRVRPEEIYPKYLDDAEYELFTEFNESVDRLVKAGLVMAGKKHGDIVDKIYLCIAKADECYSYVNRVPRREEQGRLSSILIKYTDEYDGKDTKITGQKPKTPLQTESGRDTMNRYAAEQLDRIRKNKNVEYYDGDIDRYEDVLRLAERILSNEEECFIRDLSIELYGDSKRLETLAGTVSSLLYKYGEFDRKETVLEECNVLRTPTYVCMKGDAEIGLGNQCISLGVMGGDIALSTESLKGLVSVNVIGNRVVTVENLTSFHDYNTEGDFVVYLGGFHNRAKREFLQLVYEQNPGKEYRHFGDIDAGGFYILEHLRNKTGILFKPLAMDVETLMKCSSYTKPLTDSDRKRLKSLSDKHNPDYRDVIEYMLEHDCKLEQESVTVV